MSTQHNILCYVGFIESLDIHNIMGMKDVKNMINVNLKNLRKAHRYTQEEVAEKLNVSRQAVAKWENGDTVPDINNCIALARLYKVTLDDLVNHSQQKDGLGIQPKGKHVFGTVKVGERGQIVIPKKAREIFNIHPGERLLVLGDEDQGIAILKYDNMMHFVEAVYKAKECDE
ncbi:helix-turn-helix transcriptional regulator [Neobacillus thermocopriae]|uniref:helix-turn-helix transcriptional regulator n=2 Tax=Neobacillus thermocopriae TaxID=1215031 RepID=UPI002E251A27